MTIIFDLDGTLLNSIDDLGHACNYALEHCGYATHPIEAYPRMVGNGINNLIRRALPENDRSEETIMRLRAFFVPYYNTHNCDYTRPYEGIPAVLEVLKKQGVRLGVASNKYQEATTKIIGELYPSIRFSAVLGQREGINIKPDPQIVFDLLQATGVDKADVLYVGDSGVDMQTGLNAGVETCGVTWGFRPRTELEPFHPQHIVDSVEELRQIIMK